MNELGLLVSTWITLKYIIFREKNIQVAKS